MPEINDVAVGDKVLLALEPQRALIAARGERSELQEPIGCDDLGPDEPTLDVRVDRPRSFLRRRVARDGPRAAFVFADGEKRDVPEQVVRGADNAVEARFGEAEIGEKRL